jgi:signal transduction histidine kinase
MIGVIYDVTNRKQLERQKDDFISVASHELKTPLTTIKAYSGVLEDVLQNSENAESVEIVKKLNQQVDRLVKLVNSLLDADIAEGKIKLSPETFDLNQLVLEHVKLLQLTTTTHKLYWHPGNIGLIHADRQRIGQVITNFITNAVKYSPGRDRVIITTEDRMDGVVFQVQDFGKGLGPEQHLQVFERYYRSSDHNIENIPGLGLGLYISAEIIKQHSGAIWVESLAGEGSSFYFKLPYS